MLNNHTEKLHRVRSFIEDDSHLCSIVLDIQKHQDTLVVLCDHSQPISKIKYKFKNIWDGPIEIYCASELFAGGTAAYS